MQNLPSFPGYSFKDIGKDRFHRCQTLGFKNGFNQMKQVRYKIGGREILDHNIADDTALDSLEAFDPELVYGKSCVEHVPAFVPHFVKFDKKVLGFKVWLKETVRESPNETYRVRYLDLWYYLNDDTIALNEHKVDNSGLPQGMIVRRSKIPKNNEGGFWHWTDLNVGNNVSIYSNLYHIASCDEWTREWLECQGIEVRDDEDIPKDTWTEHRKVFDSGPQRVEQCEPKDCVKLCQFLKNDDKVLRFYTVMEDFDQFNKLIRFFVIQYYLSDDTIDIKEIHHRNDGMDNFPFFLNRHRVPKNRYDLDPCFNASILEISENEIKEYFSPKDFGIGKTIFIYNRLFLIYNYDNFTRAYYWKHFGITDFTPIDVSKRYPSFNKKSIPPWNYHGNLDDSMQNVRGVSYMPRKDVAKMLNYQGVVLRYLVRLDNPPPIESCRRFVMSYSLSGDHLSIYEMPSPGFKPGKFLFRTRVPKPSSISIDEPTFYGPEDFSIGASLVIYSRKFVIIDVDKYVLTFIEQNPGRIPEHVAQSIRDKLCCSKKKEEKMGEIPDGEDNLMEIMTQKPHMKTKDVCCPPIKRSFYEDC